MQQNSGERFGFDSLELNLDDDHDVVELLAGDLHCPLCGCHYDPAETRIVRARKGLVMLAVQCHCCGTGSLVTMERGQFQPASAELTPVERAFFAYLPPISNADVERARALLKAHQGDLRDLI